MTRPSSGTVGESNTPPHPEDEATTALVARYWAWADLMRRAFDIDVLACPRCCGRLRSIGTVEDPDAIHATLGALAASEELVGRAPPPISVLNANHGRRTGPEHPPSSTQS